MQTVLGIVFIFIGFGILIFQMPQKPDPFFNVREFTFYKDGKIVGIQRRSFAQPETWPLGKPDFDSFNSVDLNYQDDS